MQRDAEQQWQQETQHSPPPAAIATPPKPEALDEQLAATLLDSDGVAQYTVEGKSPADRLRAHLQHAKEKKLTTAQSLHQAFLALGPPGELSGDALIAELVNLYQQMHVSPPVEVSEKGPLKVAVKDVVPSPPQQVQPAPLRIGGGNTPPVNTSGLQEPSQGHVDPPSGAPRVAVPEMVSSDAAARPAAPAAVAGGSRGASS